MSGDVNKIILIGRLGADPQKTIGPNGSMTKFRLATNEHRVTRAGATIDKTTWFRVICFDGLADLCYQILKRGALVYIEGKIENRAYKDQQGIDRESWSVRASEVRSLSRPVESTETPRTTDSKD